MVEASPDGHGGRGQSHAAQLLPALAAQVPASAGRCYTYWTGHKGPLQCEAALSSVWRWEPERQQAQALELLISRESDGSQVNYSLCYTPPGRPALAVV